MKSFLDWFISSRLFRLGSEPTASPLNDALEAIALTKEKAHQDAETVLQAVSERFVLLVCQPSVRCRIIQVIFVDSRPFMFAIPASVHVPKVPSCQRWQHDRHRHCDNQRKLRRSIARHRLVAPCLWTDTGSKGICRVHGSRGVRPLGMLQIYASFSFQPFLLIFPKGIEYGEHGKWDRTYPCDIAR